MKYSVVAPAPPAASASRRRPWSTASASKAIDHAASAMNTASPVVATNRAIGASTRNGAARRAPFSPAKERATSSTAGTALDPRAMTAAAAQPGPVSPIRSRAPYRTSSPGGWPFDVDRVGGEPLDVRAHEGAQAELAHGWHRRPVVEAAGERGRQAMAAGGQGQGDGPAGGPGPRRHEEPAEGKGAGQPGPGRNDSGGRGDGEDDADRRAEPERSEQRDDAEMQLHATGPQHRAPDGHRDQQERRGGEGERHPGRAAGLRARRHRHPLDRAVHRSLVASTDPGVTDQP